jgi:23S rRNA (cytidine1920-2'-O)/16S rRNA (cytidine1409-2'-O)-methyltransferase
MRGGVQLASVAITAIHRPFLHDRPNVPDFSAWLIFMGVVWEERPMTARPTPPTDTDPSAPRTAREKPAGKTRIDQLLVERGLVESRARAQALILAGLVFVGETKIAKAGQTVPIDAAIDVRGRDHPWVSRGGIKLAHAIAHFGLDPKGVTAMDIGSSTGGFTDVLLQQGAAHVFAVDSGTNQLAWKLRQDPRVTVLEQTSARILTSAQIDRPATWVVCDASFIALAKVLEVPLALAARPTRLVALIKPQFEVGRGEVGKGGVVRDPALHARVCGEVRDWLESAGWDVQGIVESPITGPEGNVEFLISAERG